jgi:hypothetical protein
MEYVVETLSVSTPLSNEYGVTWMQRFNFDSLANLELRNVIAEVRPYHGRSALRLIEQDMLNDQESIAILSDSKFKDGIIETAIAGSPRAEAPTDMRGFVGIAFRVQPHGSHFECFYLRPTNGRADDQLRRNQSFDPILFTP